MTDRIWNGRAAFVMGASSTPGKPIGLALTEEAARKTALALLRLKQTTIPLSGDVQELLDALNYVLVGDPESRAAHRRKEAGKGMTPDGGYRAPDERLRRIDPDTIRHAREGQDG